MPTRFGVVVTARADSGMLPIYSALNAALEEAVPSAGILDSWCWPKDLDVGEDGIPIYDVTPQSNLVALKDFIDDYCHGREGPFEVTLLGRCAGAQTALRYCRWDHRVTRVVAIEPTTWYHFASPYDYDAALKRINKARPYSPLITRQLPTDQAQSVEFRLAPKLYSVDEQHLSFLLDPPESWFFVPLNWPEMYFIAGGHDSVTPPDSVRRLYEQARVPDGAGKGYIEVGKANHDFGDNAEDLANVLRAVRRCLIGGGNFDERW